MNSRAHGNGHGDTAGVKIDFAFDSVVSHTPHLATEQDKTIGKEFVAGVPSGDLVLRDMGYFILAEFDEIERRRAFWLSRPPLTTNVVVEKGRRLEDHLHALVLAGMIAHQLGMRIAARLGRRVASARLSDERLHPSWPSTS